MVPEVFLSPSKLCDTILLTMEQSYSDISAHLPKPPCRYALYMMRGKNKLKFVLIGKFPNLHRLSVMYTNLEWDYDWRPIVVDEATGSFVPYHRNSPDFLKSVPALNKAKAESFNLSTRRSTPTATGRPLEGP